MWDLIKTVLDLVTGGLLSRYKRSEAHAEAFRASFASAISHLNLPRSDDRQVLQVEFDGHYHAYHAIRVHLTKRACRKLDTAWQRYEAHCRSRVEVSILERIGTEVLDPKRMADPAHHEEVRVMRRQQALELIEALLRAV